MSTAKCASCPRIEQLRRGLCKRCYTREWTRQTMYGRWESERVASEPVRAHVLALRDAGVSLRRVPALAGVPRNTVQTLLRGKPGRPPAAWVARSTAERLLAVQIPAVSVEVAAGHAVVPVIGARRRLQALVAAGWTMSYLAAEIGVTPGNFTTMMHHRDQITAARHREVTALFERLQMTPGPSDRARLYARRRRWPLPMQWDEDAFDDPAAPIPTSTIRREPYSYKAAL